MKVIYIAGPYRSQYGEWHVRQNIRKAEEAAAFVWLNGGVALCPHKNTAGFGGLPGCPDDVWLQGDLELLRRCDAIWLIDGWRDSIGACKEMEFARILGLPRLHTRDGVVRFIENSTANVKKYRLRIPSISLAWSDVIEARSKRDAIYKYADRLNSKTIDYYEESVYEVEEIDAQISTANAD